MNFLISQSMIGSYIGAAFINFAIFGLFILTFTYIFLWIFATIFPKTNKTTAIYFYSLTSASLLINGSYGFYGEASEKLNQYFGSPHSANHHHESPTFTITLIKISIFGLGIILGVTTFLFARSLLHYRIKNKEVHVNHNTHDHSDLLITRSDLDDPKKAWVALLLMLLHRGIDGFFFGSLISKFSNDLHNLINWGLVFSFLFHNMFDTLIFYYHQVNHGESRSKAIKKTVIAMVSTILPTLLVGSLFYPFIFEIGWALPLFNIMGGTSLIIAAIMEFVPEFIHARHSPTKHFVYMLLSFGIGIILTTALLQFHFH